MKTRDEMIEIAARAIFDDSNAVSSSNEDVYVWETYEHQRWYREHVASAIEALIAAGVIPAEGAVAVDAKRFLRIQSSAHQAHRLQRILRDQFDYIDEYGIPFVAGDLDAVLVAKESSDE